MHVTSVQPWIRVTGLACFTVVVLNACGGGGSGGSAPVAPRVIATIAVSPSGVTLNALGATAQLEATATDQNGDNISAQVTWGSSDTAVATVDADGLVTAVNNGTATVTVRSGAVSNSVSVTVEQQPASVTLSRDEAVFTAVGETLQLEASVSDANDNSTSSEISWESSDPGVVLVDENGRITARSHGSVTITATVFDQGRSVSDSVEIIVRRPLTVSGNPNVYDTRTGRTPLHIAAMANTPGLIAALVAAGADVDAHDRDGLTPLHAAAYRNRVAAITALLEAGADINARSYDGKTPLQYAYSSEAFVALLEAGADFDVRDAVGRTPLHLAALAVSHAPANDPLGEMAMLAALLDAGADLNVFDLLGRTPLHTGGTPLHTAAEGTNPAAAVALAAAGADPNARNTDGWTPLRQWAGHGDNPAILAALLEAGADIETLDNDGDPLLHLAAERDRPAAIAALLEAGADLNARDRSGGTALHAAAASKAMGSAVAAAAIAVLLEAGADPTALDDSGLTALQSAPPEGSVLMTALLDAHAGRSVVDPNARDRFGYTALHAAARANSPRLIEALVQAGADVDALDNDGHTPLLVAAGAQRQRDVNAPPATFNPDAITVLAAAGADLEVPSSNGYAALHLAIVRNEIAMIPALLEAGASIESLSPARATALQTAMAEGNTAAIEILARFESDREAGDYREFAAVVALAVSDPAALAASGVDPNARDEDGRTALHWAAAWDVPVALAAVAALLEAGADPNARDRVDSTPLHWVAERGNWAMVAPLVEGGANPNARNIGDATALSYAARSVGLDTVAALVAAGADLEARDADGRTALQQAAYRGDPIMVAALVEAGADLEARDADGRTALHLAASRDEQPFIYARRSTAAAIAALLEAGANIDSSDSVGNSALLASASSRNQAATGILLAFGAEWTSDPDPDVTLNTRFLAVELFQGPMVWQWEPGESAASGSGSDMSEGNAVDHAKTLLHRATTVAVRIGSEIPDPMPELSVTLTGAHGQAWAAQVETVHEPRIVGVPGDSETGLWETEYVFELPADWVETGHRASLAIDPYNRLEETDEDDNQATLNMDGHAAPVFDVTFVPIVLSGDHPGVDPDIYMAVIGDLLPIGDYTARIGRVLDLSDRNLGASNTVAGKFAALDELLHRWNAEAREEEYYHGAIYTAGVYFEFGGAAFLNRNVSVSDYISTTCQPEREYCGSGSQAHELGHNFGLIHAPAGCEETAPLDPDYPYPRAGIGPRRGWAGSRNVFVNPGPDNPHFDVMGYCRPNFVSDYNYNKMVDYRLGVADAPGDSERRGPSLEIGAAPPGSLPSSALTVPTVAYAPPPGAASTSDVSGPGRAVTGIVEELGSSLAFTGTVDEFGLWSVFRIDASTQPARSPSAEGAFFFTLQDAFQREIYREPMALLALVHGETRRSWAVRVPVPEQAPAFLAILDAEGTPVFIQPFDVPADLLMEN